MIRGNRCGGQIDRICSEDYEERLKDEHSLNEKKKRPKHRKRPKSSAGMEHEVTTGQQHESPYFDLIIKNGTCETPMSEMSTDDWFEDIYNSRLSHCRSLGQLPPSEDALVAAFDDLELRLEDAALISAHEREFRAEPAGRKCDDMKKTSEKAKQLSYTEDVALAWGGVTGSPPALMTFDNSRLHQASPGNSQLACHSDDELSKVDDWLEIVYQAHMLDSQDVEPPIDFRDNPDQQARKGRQNQNVPPVAADSGCLANSNHSVSVQGRKPTLNARRAQCQQQFLTASSVSCSKQPVTVLTCNGNLEPVMTSARPTSSNTALPSTLKNHQTLQSKRRNVMENTSSFKLRREKRRCEWRKFIKKKMRSCLQHPATASPRQKIIAEDLSNSHSPEDTLPKDDNGNQICQEVRKRPLTRDIDQATSKTRQSVSPPARTEQEETRSLTLRQSSNRHLLVGARRKEPSTLQLQQLANQAKKLIDRPPNLGEMKKDATNPRLQRSFSGKIGRGPKITLPGRMFKGFKRESSTPNLRQQKPTGKKHERVARDHHEMTNEAPPSSVARRASSC